MCSMLFFLFERAISCVIYWLSDYTRLRANKISDEYVNIINIFNIINIVCLLNCN